MGRSRVRGTPAGCPKPEEASPSNRGQKSQRAIHRGVSSATTRHREGVQQVTVFVAANSSDATKKWTSIHPSRAQ
ncbi:hypothetical protein F2P79_008594 [Pimephales promelas]|nr:hypothetical protein F2P79_008594 [Pimephales promelas]